MISFYNCLLGKLVKSYIIANICLTVDVSRPSGGDKYRTIRRKRVRRRNPEKSDSGWHFAGRKDEKIQAQAANPDKSRQKYKLKRSLKDSRLPAVWSWGYPSSRPYQARFTDKLWRIRFVRLITTPIRSLAPVAAGNQEASVLEYAQRIVF